MKDLYHQSRRLNNYDLGMVLFNFQKSKTYRGRSLDFGTGFPTSQEIYKSATSQLIDLGILCPHKDFPEGRVFTIIGNRYQEPGDIACSVDPFAYLSHLSAMEYHGLTNRLPKLLFISTPPRSE